MTAALDNLLGIHETALALRARRNEVLASNIANADTPGYRARDFDFRAALASAAAGRLAPGVMATSSARHFAAGADGAGSATPLGYRTVVQASPDNNTVDINIERAQFADNAVRFEASLAIINARLKSVLAAITG